MASTDDGWSESILAENTMATRWFDGETDLGGRPAWSHLWDQCFATVEQYEAHRRGESAAAALEAELSVRSAEVVYVPGTTLTLKASAGPVVNARWLPTSSRHSRAPAAPAAAAMRPRSITWALVAIVAVGVALRAWRLGFNGLTYDESFTAMAARLPLGQLFDHLRTQDTHPPLDYLLRAPLAVRVRPTCSCGSRRSCARSVRSCSSHGGCAHVASPDSWPPRSSPAALFQIYHGGEARMYVLLELLGVAAAIVADRWLGDDPPRWCTWVAGGLVAVALFDHVSGFLLAAGMIAVASFRTDRRGGAACRHRRRVPRCGRWCGGRRSRNRPVVTGSVGSPERRCRASRGVSGQLTDVEPLALLVLAGVVAGGVCLWRDDRRLGHVWLAVGAVPFLAAAVIGIVSPFLIDRAVTVASWAPPLALGYAAAWMLRRSDLLGRAFVVAVLAVVVIGTITFLAGKRYDSDLAVDHLRVVAQPGDVIATRPARYATLPAYAIGVREWR